MRNFVLSALVLGLVSFSAAAQDYPKVELFGKRWINKDSACSQETQVEGVGGYVRTTDIAARTC
jgi:hypothetical protein